MTTMQVPASGSRLAEVLRRLGKSSNWLTRHLAGRRFVTIWAVVRYRGRHSGKEYAIPVAIGATKESFVIPLPFAGAQWILNVLAAGECIVRWNGRDWHATAPEIIEKADAVAAFGPFPRFTLRFVPIHRFLRLARA
jgi:hypothetical protein